MATAKHSRGDTAQMLVALCVLAAHVALVAALVMLRAPLVRAIKAADDLLFVRVAPPPEAPPPAAVAPPDTPTPPTPSAAKASPKLPGVAPVSAADDDAPPSVALGDGGWHGIATAPRAPTVVPPRRVPPDYADKVRERIVARLVRPRDAVYQVAGGKAVARECTVPYEITVDRAGAVLDVRIEGCGDAALDAAALAAIRQGAPYPPPPGDAERHVVYGVANFRAQ